jgi:hypothetical protein
VFRDMVRQTVRTHYLVAPLIERHINVRDGSTECLGIFRRDAMHILRSRPDQFVDLANMSGWTHQDGCNDLSHIRRVDRRGASGPKRQPNRRVPGNRFRRPVREKGCWRKTVGRTLTTGNPDQFSTCSQSQCCRCWGESVISVRLICETVI